MLSVDFENSLLRAKKDTYASGMPPNATSHPGSQDLVFREPFSLYIDSYFGGFHFTDEEALWLDNFNIWGNNDHVKMLTAETSERFNQFLKTALLLVPPEAPFRGPAEFISADVRYLYASTGDLYRFEGAEEIHYHGAMIYEPVFHGGEIRH